MLAERFLVNLDRLLSGNIPALGADAVGVFSAARQEQVSLQILKPGEAARVQSISASDEARIRLEAHLAGGQTVLVPERALSIGSSPILSWWLVDADSGTVRDEMENGRHTAPEDVTQRAKTTENVPRYHLLGVRIYCWITKTAKILGIVLHLTGGMEQGQNLLSIEEGRQKIEETNREAHTSPKKPGCGAGR